MAPCKLSIQLGHFQDSEHLAGMHTVADIDIDPADVTGDFGMEIDVLIRDELAGDSKAAGDRAADYGNYGRSRKRVGFRGSF